MDEIGERGDEQPAAGSAGLHDPAASAAAACLVASGIACAVFGLTVVLATASEGAKKWLEFYAPAGSLSGKGIVATGAWVVSWAGLHLGLRHRPIELPRYLRLTFALVGVSLILTFPPFFELFAPHG